MIAEEKRLYLSRREPKCDEVIVFGLAASEARC